MIPKSQVTVFQTKILNWYQINQRDLPWRKTRDPYNILISEIMSQQTQLSRVVPKYVTWIEKFPTVRHLAKAPVSEVLHYWSGLGYNRRALHLKKTAEIVANKYNGIFPSTEKELLSLPGIGQYTARAVLCFAFNQQVVVVDTNVRKVILTQFIYEVGKSSKNFNSGSIIRDSGKDISDKEIEAIAQTLLPQGFAYEWNQALMDYAAAVLKKEKIPIPKQSKFIGSRRYYRGQILKILLEKKKVPASDLGVLIKKDFSQADDTWLEKLLGEMEKEGFIVKEKDHILLTT